MTTTIVSGTIRLLADSALCIWMFRKLPGKKTSSALLAFLWFLLTIPLYVPAGYPMFLDNAIARLLIRAASVLFYLLFSKERGKTVLIYDTLYYTLCLTTCQNIFMTPFLSQVRKGTVLLIGNPFLKIILSLSIEYLVIFGILSLIDHTVNMENIHEADHVRFIVCIGLTLIQLYMRASLRQTMLHAATEELKDTMYPLFGFLMTLVILVITEHYIQMLKWSAEEKLQYMLTRQQFTALQNQLKLNEETRYMRHDMKNHLVAIQALKNEPEKIEQYTNTLLGSLQAHEISVETGNTMLDGLLAQKAHIAREKQIHINYYANFENVDFVEDVSLCTIISNALDNAIEAASQVADPSRRRVHFKAGIFANSLILRFENYYEKEPKRQTDSFITIKQDKELHGYGLKNIRRAVEQYNGTINIEMTEDKLFRLTVALLHN